MRLNLHGTFVGILASLCVLATAQAQEKSQTAADSAVTGSAAKADSSGPASKKSVPTKAKAKPATAAKGASKKTDGTAIKTERATFGGGCFWCMEAVFESVRGVKSVVSGYAGGTVARPTYEMVCSGTTGHAEVVQVEFDPEVVTYERLVDIFWKSHDPTQLNRQGDDFGTQYRSIILYHDDDQKKAAEKSYRKLVSSGTYSNPIVTELAPMTAFWPAERKHQDFFRKHRASDYSQIYILPKLQELKSKLNSESKRRR
jgi:peptide-methionine (S)-S-oxide reductase